jgi:hypothetical protein
MRVLFAREWLNVGMPWSDLAPVLPGWEIEACATGDLLARVDGADVVRPFGARVEREVIEVGGFGLIQQFGVGLDGIDLEAATEHGVLGRPPARRL